MTDQSKSLLHIFIDEADRPIAMFDREMRYLAASQQWIDRLCCGDRGVIGRSHYDVVPGIPNHWRDMHQRVLAGETLRDESDWFRRSDGRTLWVRREMRPWHDFDGHVGGIVMSAEDLTPVVEAQQAVRESNAKSAAEAKALAGFYHAGLKSWQAASIREGLDEMLLGILDLLDTDMGSVQLLDADGKILRIVAHSGFKQDFLEFSREISAAQDTACGRALRTGNIVVVEDVELDPTDAALRSVRRAAGYRAVVTAPLINSRETPLGMISVHFRSPHRPSASEMQWLEL